MVGGGGGQAQSLQAGATIIREAKRAAVDTAPSKGEIFELPGHRSLCE